MNDVWQFAELGVAVNFTDLVDQLTLPNEAIASPFDNHLFTGNSKEPNLRERVEIARLVTKMEDTLDSIHSATSHLNQLLQFLGYSRTDFANELFAHYSLIAPVGRLPVELLQEIFSLVQPPFSDRGHTPPPVVAQVNRRWRHVAIHTPYLWSYIYISNPSRNLNPVSTLLWTDICLQRSQLHPLTLTICVYGNLDNAILERLISNSDRWNTLIFSERLPLNLVQALQENSVSLPALKSCGFSPNAGTGPSVRHSVHWDFLTRAPKLTHVRFHQGINVPFSSVPWSQITSWDGNISNEAMPTILTTAALLQTGHFRINSRISRPPRNGNMSIDRHTLTSLQLDYVWSTNIRLDLLPRFPFLKKFSLRIPTGPIADPVSTIPPFFETSASNIEYLRITIETAIQWGILRRCLEHAPKVACLYLGCGDLTDEAIHGLTFPNYPTTSEQRGILPNLHTLCLGGDFQFDPKTVPQLARSRIGATHCVQLRMLRLLPNLDFVGLEFKEQLQEALVPMSQDLEVDIRGLDLNKFKRHGYRDADGNVFEIREKRWTLEYMYTNQGVHP